MKKWIHAATDRSAEDYAKFLNKYRSYFDQIDKAVREVASKYDSDMRFDLDLIVENSSSVDHIVNMLAEHGELAFGKYLVSISHALGLKAVDPRPVGIPEYFTDGNIKVFGPMGIYYNGDSPYIELKYFDSDLKRLKIAVKNYFESLKHNLETGDRWGLSQRYEDDYPERAEERAQREAEAKKARTASRRKWSSVLSQLRRDLEDMNDPIYEQTSAGYYIASICGEVEDALNYYVEPSTQGGRGGVWIYDEANNNEVIVRGYDFETFDSEIIDLALSSKNMTEFKKKYKNYLLNL